MIRLFTTSLLSLTVLCLAAQTSTSMEVYQIFQAKCASCHSGNEPAAGLDLQGIGASEQARMMNVFSNIYERTPSNGTAAAKGDAYIYPGRPDKSFIFRKANNGLEATVDLDPAEEGQIMPPYGSPPLTLAETEMIRQWIQFGAPTSGTVVDRDVIEDYYENGGLQAFPDGPPPAPAEDEGFQVKMGPFYLAPGEELEFFQKYELELPEDLEVNRLDMEFGTYSHHFIVYDFNGNGADFIPHGLRLDPDHSNIGMVAAIQEPTDLRLPEGTAFRWDDDLVLDLNSHYINYSATMPYQAEVYMNVYTQSTGTAAQEMYTDLLVNLDIYIPNDENEVTESQVINPNYGEIYLWGMMGHTHQYGTSYKAWQRTNFTNEELIYDASCPNGIPGCTSPYFDYHHIPIRYFEPLQPLTMNFANGLRHEASWINDGPTPVWFGPTSQDEMMVMVIMFTVDDEGVDVVSTNDIKPQVNVLDIQPNPATEQVIVQSPNYLQEGRLQLLDLTGRVVHQQAARGYQFNIDRGDWPAGLYTYRLETEDGRLYTGKVIWQ